MEIMDMNNKLLSYEELKKELKSLEALQKLHKRLYRCKAFGNGLVAARSQRRSSELKKEINLILTAIAHAKEARRLYEYKRLYNNADTIRGICTDNVYLPEVD